MSDTDELLYKSELAYTMYEFAATKAEATYWLQCSWLRLVLAYA